METHTSERFIFITIKGISHWYIINLGDDRTTGIKGI